MKTRPIAVHRRHSPSCGKLPANSSQRLSVTTCQLASKKTNHKTPARSTPQKAPLTSVSSVPPFDAKRLRRTHSRARTERGRRARWRCGGSTMRRCCATGI